MIIWYLGCVNPASCLSIWARSGISHNLGSTLPSCSLHCTSTTAKVALILDRSDHEGGNLNICWLNFPKSIDSMNQAAPPIKQTRLLPGSEGAPPTDPKRHHTNHSSVPLEIKICPSIQIRENVPLGREMNIERMRKENHH